MLKQCTNLDSDTATKSYSQDQELLEVVYVQTQKMLMVAGVSSDTSDILWYTILLQVNVGVLWHMNMKKQELFVKSMCYFEYL